MTDTSYLKHYGVLGMKWGVRRYVNKDGTLTPLGVERYRGDQRKGLYDSMRSASKKERQVVRNTERYVFAKDKVTEFLTSEKFKKDFAETDSPENYERSLKDKKYKKQFQEAEDRVYSQLREGEKWLVDYLNKEWGEEDYRYRPIYSPDYDKRVRKKTSVQNQVMRYMYEDLVKSGVGQIPADMVTWSAQNLTRFDYDKEPLKYKAE